MSTTTEKTPAAHTMESIRETMTEYLQAETEYNETASDAALEKYDDLKSRVYASPLSVRVRAPWRNLGEENDSADEFEILMGTGGPAVRIRGTIDRGEAESATLQGQDWGTPWTDEWLSAEDEETLLAFCRVFCFEE